MGFIYKITNKINGQSYIGLTTRSVEIRWKEHCRHTDQLIGQAIAQYGPENFTLEIIEECNDNIIDEREIYWISYYNTYNQGYNATLGGRVNKMICTDQVPTVLALWEQGLTINRIVQQTGLNVETVRNYLIKNNITSEMIHQRAKIFIGKAKAKPVGQFTQTGDLIKIWESQAQIIRECGYARSTLKRAITNNKCLDGYIWKKMEDL